MPDPWMREITCRDRAGRSRALQIFLTEGHDIALAAPPGEVAIIEPRQVNDMKQALTDAQVESFRRRGSW